MPAVTCPKCASRYDPGMDEELANIDPSQMSLKVVCPVCGQWLRLPENEPVPSPAAPPDILKAMMGQSRIIERGANVITGSATSDRILGGPPRGTRMSEIKFSCHACGQVLQVGGDKAGRKAKCVQCGTVLTIPAGTDPLLSGPPGAGGPGSLELPQRKAADPEVDDAGIEAAQTRRPPPLDDDEPRRRRRDRDRDDWDDRDSGIARAKASPWEKVRLGFLIAFIGLCVMAGAHAIGVLGILIGMASPGGGLALARIAAFFMFLGTIGAIVGHVFWLFVSNRNNLFGYAVAGLSVAGFYLLMQMVLLVMLFNPIGVGAIFVMILIDLTQAAHFILICLYLRALAQQLDEPALEKSSLLPMILAAAHAGYGLLTKVIMMSLAGAVSFGTGYRILTAVLGFLGAALVVVVFVFVLLAVYRGKQLVDRA